MKKSILSICILTLVFFLSCDINAFNELLGQSQEREKFLEEENTKLENLSFRKKTREVREGQSVDIDNIFNGADEVLNKDVSDLGIAVVKEENVNVDKKGNIPVKDENSIESDMSFLKNFDNRFKDSQWWDKSYNNTWENFDKMSIEARDRVKNFYDIWINAIKAYEIADKALTQAIIDLNKVKDENGTDDMIFEAQKRVDAAVGVWLKAKEAEERAGKNLRLADDYLSRIDAKIEATIEVFGKFVKLDNGKKNQY